LTSTDETSETTVQNSSRLFTQRLKLFHSVQNHSNSTSFGTKPFKFNLLNIKFNPLNIKFQRFLVVTKVSSFVGNPVLLSDDNCKKGSIRNFYELNKIFEFLTQFGFELFWSFISIIFKFEIVFILNPSTNKKVRKRITTWQQLYMFNWSN